MDIEYKNMNDDEYHRTFLENRKRVYKEDVKGYILNEEQVELKKERYANTFIICLFLIIFVFSFIYHINL